ncbi:hypothetical protein N9345_04720 [Candidatus Thioglobus sp.]|nr:hypothetical protein [Candidatus Thioglobus sp.]MDB3893466.1 hypothetical protein [Candidatus Thioglobus sp.]MDB9829167.1 hypothetical protein [Candidatus Thioglobus sp.]MDC0388734.1 hypothetical protein [Candidatus Thioglobus sp.]MDC0920413.1 hypothetical protein [Candidatus Thioglobus sp.]
MIKQIPLLIMLLSLNTIASPLSDGALRLIQIGNEIGSRDVVLRGQSLLLKGAFDLNDFDAMYEASKQLRQGSELMGYSPQEREANEILIKLVRRSYDTALYEYAMYLLDGDNGFIKNEFLALNLFEESFKVHGNPNSAMMAAIIRNESLVPGTKKIHHINELITFAILNNVSGAKAYQTRYIEKDYLSDLAPESWRDWIKAQAL